MKIKQLSIFMENQVGVINSVTKILADRGVNMRAFSVAEGAEFGILRLIVENPDDVQKMLQEEGFKVNTTEVIGLQLPNVAGALSSVMECLAREGVFIQYMYAFSDGDVASTVIRPTQIDRCIEILDKCREELTAKNPLYRL
ncbi:MAG: ACT domain-containing protein [Rikenellaceae bacterium]